MGLTTARRDGSTVIAPASSGTGSPRAEVIGRKGYASYKVRKGDTLCAISRKFFRTPAYYLKIFEANSDVLSDPDVLPEGVTLRIPKP